MSSYLLACDWNILFQTCFDVNSCWSLFVDVMNEAIHKFVPVICTDVKKKSQRLGVKYPRFIQKLQKHKAIAWKKWKTSNLKSDHLLYKSIAKQCSNAIKNFHTTKELELIRKHNLGSFYNFVNKKLNTPFDIRQIKKPDGELTNNPNEIAEIFNNYFASVFTTDNGSTPVITPRVADDTTLTSIVFTPHIIERTLKSLNPSTSAGPDGLPNIFLKKCASSIALPLCHIFDISFKDSVVPECWKYACVTPIFKKGCTSDVNNYRPISLTSTCCRVMERIINLKLLDYLLLNKLITPQQHGFVRKRSTCTNLLECLQDWTLNLQNRMNTDVIYFDFRKAFDSVSHVKLLSKLPAYGISGCLLNWISAFLTNRSQVVKFKNSCSCPVSVSSGVPQGSVLGPTLFLLYINDVCDIFLGLTVKTKLYADDIKMYSCYKLPNDQSDLQHAVDRLYDWSNKWQLQLAADKCHFIRLAGKLKNNSTNCLIYNINKSNLEKVDIVKDLGITVDGKLKFDTHISSVVHKAMARARLILKCFQSRNNTLLLKAYCTYVRPLLEYCTAVWTPHSKYLINKIERVQRFFTKRLSGLWNTEYSRRLQLLSLLSLERRREIYDLVLCYKILHGYNDTTLSDSFTKSMISKTRGHEYKLLKNHCSVDLTKYYFTNRVIDHWNSLPSDIVKAPSAVAFKKCLLRMYTA